MKRAVRYGLYPMLLAIASLVAYLSIRYGWSYKSVYGLFNLGLVAFLLLVERAFPLSSSWAMTRRSFLRDIKYILFVAPTISITRTAFGMLAIHLAGRYQGPLSGAAVIPALAAFLLVFEFFQYWYHRLSHELRGPAGRMLWGIHLAHHLPDRVYVVMHAVFHPLNAIIVTALIQGSMLALGISPAVAFVAMLLIDLQSLISHLNVDLRLGPLSYVFIGTETHRYHHSADPKEAGNFGNTLAIWDLIFGSFRYHPGTLPPRLGVTVPSAYPASEQLLKVLSYPVTGGDQEGTA